MAYLIAFRSRQFEIRAIPAAFPEPAKATHQQLYDRMIKFQWNSSKSATGKLAKKDINYERWADEFHQSILEAHANAHWIGRDLVGSGQADFSYADVIAGRNQADIDAEYLQGFIDDLIAGRYTDPETGDLLVNQIYNRQRLYIGRARGTSAQASVDGLKKDDEIYWRLGGAEEHCAECPVLAEMGPFFKDDLFTTPGAGGTPCLGNCLCHLELTHGGETLNTIKPVELSL